MENTSDYLMLGLLLICMKYDKKVCYKVLDNTYAPPQVCAGQSACSRGYVYQRLPQEREAAYQRTANAFQTSNEVMYQ